MQCDRRLDKVFDELLKEVLPKATFAKYSAMDNKDKLEISVHIPGYGPDDVVLSLYNGVLEVWSTNKEDKNAVLGKIYLGTDKYDTDKIEAKLLHGVLTIKVPYAGQKACKVIKVT